MTCPLCQSDQIALCVDWSAWSLDPIDKDNMATITEYQCKLCDVSFWLPAKEKEVSE